MLVWLKKTLGKYGLNPDVPVDYGPNVTVTAIKDTVFKVTVGTVVTVLSRVMLFIIVL